MLVRGVCDSGVRKDESAIVASPVVNLRVTLLLVKNVTTSVSHTDARTRVCDLETSFMSMFNGTLYNPFSGRTFHLVGWMLFIRFGAIMGLARLRFVYDPRVSKGRQIITSMIV